MYVHVCQVIVNFVSYNSHFQFISISLLCYSSHSYSYTAKHLRTTVKCQRLVIANVMPCTSGRVQTNDHTVIGLLLKYRDLYLAPFTLALSAIVRWSIYVSDLQAVFTFSYMTALISDGVE